MVNDYEQAIRTQKVRAESSFDRANNQTRASNHSQERTAVAASRQTYHHNMDLNHDLGRSSVEVGRDARMVCSPNLNERTGAEDNERLTSIEPVDDYQPGNQRRDRQRSHSSGTHQSTHSV